MMVGRLLKRLLQACGVVGAFLMAFCALVLFINRHDVAPSHDALALTKLLQQRPAVLDRDNGFHYFLGLNSAVDVSPRDHGKAMMASPRTEAMSLGKPLPGDDDFTARRSNAVIALREACRKLTECAAALADDPQGTAEWVSTERWLRLRYTTLIDHQQWRAPLASLSADSPLPRLTTAIDGQILYFIDLRQRAQGGDAAGARALMAEDLRFWRNMLAESETLIIKMFAVTMVNRHFALGTMTLRALPSAMQADVLPALWRAPLTEAERSMQLAYAGEVEFTKSILRTQMEKPDDTTGVDLAWPSGKFLLHVQATSNDHASNLLALDRVLNVDYPRLGHTIDKARALVPLSSGGSMLYNPIGKLVVQMGSGDKWPNYTARVADLEGMRRMHVLAADLRSAGTAAGTMATALNRASTSNPYTGQPYTWSDTRRAVTFRGLQEGDRAEHVAPL